jgi:hypothetical protein
VSAAQSRQNIDVPTLRTVAVTRYVTPLREGGSLPAIVEADDSGLYVLKFRGAGHGALALVAELVCGEIGRRLGLPIPVIALASLEVDLARTEPDPEIHALIHDSAGLNLAIDYLPGSINFDPIVHRIPPELASKVVWFDALVSNVDRTAKNTNMLIWHKQPILIDHGSAMYFHHSPGWDRDQKRPRSPFLAVSDHVLLPSASMIRDIDETMASVLTPEVIADVLADVPDSWLSPPMSGGQSEPVAGGEPEAARRAYRRYFTERLAPPRTFVPETLRGR